MSNIGIKPQFPPTLASGGIGGSDTQKLRWCGRTDCALPGAHSARHGLYLTRRQRQPRPRRDTKWHNGGRIVGYVCIWIGVLYSTTVWEGARWQDACDSDELSSQTRGACAAHFHPDVGTRGRVADDVHDAATADADARAPSSSQFPDWSIGRAGPSGLRSASQCHEPEGTFPKKGSG